MRVLPLLPGLEAMHVLIIEDEPLIAMSIEDALRHCGATSFALAISLDAAVAAAKRRCPDLITADVQLAPGCGIDAVAAICATKVIPGLHPRHRRRCRRPTAGINHRPQAIRRRGPSPCFQTSDGHASRRQRREGGLRCLTQPGILRSFQCSCWWSQSLSGPNC